MTNKIMKLQPHEVNLIGKWVVDESAIRVDATCGRIEWLTKNHLKKIAISPQSGAWKTLFKDPDGERFWERTYFQDEMHGGGPPAQNYLTAEQAKVKYGEQM